MKSTGENSVKIMNKCIMEDGWNRKRTIKILA